MRFTAEQRFALPRHEVLDAYLEPSLYDTFSAIPAAGEVRGLDARRAGRLVEVRAAYRFTGNLPPVAGRIVDKGKLTWVHVTTYDPEDGTATFVMVPDHYPALLTCRGGIAVEAEGAGCVRRITTDLRLHLPLLARPLTGAAEGAVAGDLRKVVAAEVPLVEAFVAARR